MEQDNTKLKDYHLKNALISRVTLDTLIATISTLAIGFLLYIEQSEYGYFALTVITAALWSFGLSLITLFFSHTASEKVSHLCVNYYETGCTNWELYNKIPLWTKITKYSNCMSISCVYLGIFITLVYATVRVLL